MVVGTARPAAEEGGLPSHAVDVNRDHCVDGVGAFGGDGPGALPWLHAGEGVG